MQHSFCKVLNKFFSIFRLWANDIQNSRSCLQTLIRVIDCKESQHKSWTITVTENLHAVFQNYTLYTEIDQEALILTEI